jgi:hypothetical protein
MPPPPPLAGLYADADIVAALYITFLALDPVLGLTAAASLDAAIASLDTAVSARPRRRLPHPQR